jgi:hypothetical protein
VNDQVKSKKAKGKGGPLFLLIFSFGLVFPYACGKKGDPRAPELVAPEPIKDLRAEAGAGGVVLTWSRPTRYLDGREIRDLAGFRIFRQELPRSCPECPAPFRERASVNVEDREKFVKTKRFRFVDQELKPETVYRYRVISQLTDGSLSDPSNEREITWRPS